MLLSFIIPLYNCQSFIRNCLDSIYNTINLNKENFEVIVVDDGSTDDSYIICKEYENTFSNFRLATQKNAGASAARNKGLEISKGKWVWFVDGDDKISSEATNLINELNTDFSENIDLICFNYYVENERSIDKNENFHQSKEYDGVGYLSLHHRLYLWDKIFKRSAIGNIRFLNGTKNIEDMLFCLETIVDMDKIFCKNLYGYTYNNLNINSTSRCRNNRNLIKLSQDSFTIHTALNQYLETKDGDKRKILSEIENFSIIGHLYSLIRFYSLNSLRRGINKYRSQGLFPLRFTYNRKANLFVLLINCETVVLLIKRIADLFTIKR